MASCQYLLVVALLVVLADGGVIVPDPTDAETKIVGGDTITINEAPWQVYIKSIVNATSYYGCGGSIISKRWVLTAAHCTYGYDRSQIEIMAGSNSLEKGGKWYEVEDVKMHQQYNDDMVHNDICLLKTTANIEVGRAVTLPGPQATRPPVHDELRVSGWGRMENGKSPTLLRAVTVRMQKFTQCGVIGYSNETTQICVGLPGKNFCSGDSGGPVVKDKVLVGVVSYMRFGTSCGDFHAVATDVTRYTDWITTYANV